MRIILYTGKGGVGKTSIASATAIKAASLGYKTLIISTDSAHSLGDSLDTPLTGTPAMVAENLWAQEIDVRQDLGSNWSTVRTWLAALMRWQGADEVLAEEMAVMPGMEELSSLLHINSYHREGFYDLLLVDCAPTAETLRLLSFPDVARWYMRRLFPIERRVAAALGPLARGILGLPVPEAQVFESVQGLYDQLEEMRALLLDESTSSIRLVVNPEKMVIKEAQRTFTYLNLYGYHTDLIVCNRVLPDIVEDPFFHQWRRIQGQHLDLITEAFAPIPIFHAPLMDNEVVGSEQLGKLGDVLFADKDPADIFYTGKVEEISRVDDAYQMQIKLPFTSSEELSVTEVGNELIVQAGHHRRSIVLPKLLAALHVGEARLDQGTLTLKFEKATPS